MPFDAERCWLPKHPSLGIPFLPALQSIPQPFTEPGQVPMREPQLFALGARHKLFLCYEATTFA